MQKPPQTSPSSLPVRPDFFEKYEISEQIGKGGQGDVWRVWDLELRRPVAMKRLSETHLSSESVVYRFLAEAQIASQLEHPGVLPIFDVGLDPDWRPFYTTPLWLGTTLDHVWRSVQGRGEVEWKLNRAVELLIRVCEIMAHAHSRGVIHRDLKPSNILVGSFGEVRVIDWGSAYVLEAERANFRESFVPLNRTMIRTDREQAMWGLASSPLATAASGYPVTVVFMPPEALRAEAADFGVATDIYSVGVMLYQLLSGQLPYSDSDGNLPAPAVLRAKVFAQAAEPVRSRRRPMSRDLASICDKAMAHAKSSRYSTMTELANDLRAFLEVRPVQARAPGMLLTVARWSQRHKVQVLSGGLILFILAVSFFFTRGLQAQRDAARQITALREAEIAARAGRWRAALHHWEEAEAAGYDDAVTLGLARAEAWAILSSPRRARDELSQLMARSNLRYRRATVLLRVAEHELFDSSTSAQGEHRVREALALGLSGAEERFARGLLAPSTPAALELFHQAMQLNPYHHAANRHSLGLKFILGRRQEFATHARVFQLFYPDDPSPVFPQAVELMLQGKTIEA